MDSAPATSSPTVLVVDDSEDVRSVLLMILAEEGYRVIEAVDGQEGLGLALESEADLILIDLGMPRLDGPAFCRAYRERSGRAPIIVITAFSRAQAEAAAAACGAAAYVTKPFDVDHLLETIERHAGRPA